MADQEVPKYGIEAAPEGTATHFTPVIWVDSPIFPRVIDYRTAGHAHEGLFYATRGETSAGAEAIHLIPASKTSVAALAELHAPYSVVERISDFSVRIDQAAMLLSAAFMEANVTDFFRSKSPRTSKQAAVPAQWYSQIVETSLQRATEVRNALVHGWTPTGRAEHLAADAFRVLSSLSPAANELMRLYGIDRTGAFLQLAKQLEAIALQFELSADLLAEVEAKDGSRSSDERRFAELRGALLESAKGGLSLTDAAELLGVSRQAVHKRIKNGSVLGIMDGPTLVLPRAQFVDRNGKLEVVSGLPELLKLFGSAGEWSALQFLVGPDPNLAGKKPLDVLADGRVEDVLAAARAYLDIDGS